VNSGDLGERLRVDRAFQASTYEATSENLCAREARLPSERIKQREIIVVHAEGNDASLPLLCLDPRHLVPPLLSTHAASSSARGSLSLSSRICCASSTISFGTPCPETPCESGFVGAKSDVFDSHRLHWALAWGRWGVGSGVHTPHKFFRTSPYSVPVNRGSVDRARKLEQQWEERQAIADKYALD
jgi:hypothetical protein